MTKQKKNFNYLSKSNRTCMYRMPFLQNDLSDKILKFKTLFLNHLYKNNFDL